MYCPNCHSEIEDGSSFCPECGTSLEDSGSQGQNCGENSFHENTYQQSLYRQNQYQQGQYQQGQYQHGQYQQGQYQQDRNQQIRYQQTQNQQESYQQDSYQQNQYQQEFHQQSPYQNIREPEPEPLSKTPFIIIGIVVAGLILGVGGFLIFTKLKENKDQIQTEQAAEEPAGSEDNEQNGEEANIPENGQNSDENSQDSEGQKKTENGSKDETADEAGEEVIPEVTEEPELRPEDIQVSFIGRPKKISSYEEIKPSQAGSSSELVQKDTDANDPWKVLDGKEETSWQEGVNGDGIGEYLWFTFPEEKKVKYLSFKLGNWRDARYAEGNNRPKALNVTIGDFSCQVEFPKEQQEYWIQLSEAYPADQVKFEIVSVYKGTQWDDTCIAEIGMYGEKE